MMDKLLLVDGSNLLFQMFYGMPARITGKDGRAIQGTLGFVGALLKIIRMVQPTHLAVFFDGEYTSGRREIDEEYKSNRLDYGSVPEEESPFSQLPDVFRALEFLNIRFLETSVCEADDWMASYALRFGKDMDVVIASQDSDLFQLISDRVWILRYRGKQTLLCDRDYLRKKYGIQPEQYALFKSLTGDASDNIRGIHKVGPKTAAELVNQFSDISDLLANGQRISRASVWDAVLDSEERLRLNLSLIRLDDRQPLPFPVEDLLWKDAGLSTSQVLKEIGLR